MIKTELYIDPLQAKGIADQGFNALRPELVKFAERAAEQLKESIVRRLRGFGRGVAYRTAGRVHVASAPGEPPAIDSGKYSRSFNSDTRSLKRSVQGRVGSTLAHLGFWLEYGTRRIRPRPHIRPAFDAWRAALNRQL